MNPWIALSVFGLIFVAELPDKTALASLILGARYPSPLVFTGVAGAFACHVVLAVIAGSLLRLLPHRPLEIVVAAMFLVGAVLMLRGRHEDEDADALARDRLSPFRVVATSFVVVLVAEFGDLTQLLTANLAAREHDPLSVGIGAVLGLWAVAGLAIVGGSALMRFVSLRVVSRVGAAVMAALAGFTLVQALG